MKQVSVITSFLLVALFIWLAKADTSLMSKNSRESVEEKLKHKVLVMDTSKKQVQRQKKW